MSNNKIYYFVVYNCMKKKYKVHEDKDEFKDDTLDFYFKFKFINPNEVEIISDIRYSSTISNTMVILIQLLLSNNHNLIKKNQRLLLSKEIDYKHNITKQLKDAEIQYYYDNNSWHKFKLVLVK